MKLTKQIKAELATAYQCAMEISILDMRAPLRYINQYIAENVSGYGTAADEKVRSREAYRKMVMDARKQSKGMAFKAKMITPYRPRFIDPTTARFHAEIQVQLGEKKNKHVLHLCFSTVFKYQQNRWQMVLFHGSMPEADSHSADTFHIGEAERKLKELGQVIAQRTLDLKIKNRELKIEAALERVRTIAMAMKKADDMLNICKSITKELQKLGVEEIRNVQTAIIYPERGTYMNYQYYAKHDKTFITDTVYTNHSVGKRFIAKMLKGKGQLSITHIRGKQKLKEWINYQKGTNVFLDSYLYTASSLHYYWHSLGPVALGISTYRELPQEEKELFQRFLKVFELSYRRYLDIEKAEAQKKETEIELSLERVRARTMAMQKPSEFVEVINVIGEQFVHLGFDIEWVNFGANGFDVTKGIDTWNFAVIPGSRPISSRLFIPYFKHPLFTQANKQLEEYQKTGKDFFEISFNKKDKDRWLDHMFAETVFKEVPGEYRALQYAKPGYTTSNVMMKETFLSIGKFDTARFTDDQNSILKKFAKAFGQAFTRFLDLQKAEAQTREAKVEAALERVRSKAMAMHRSEDLQDAVAVVFEELNKLDLGVLRVGISVLNKEKRNGNVWLTSVDEGSPVPVYGDEDFDIHPLLQGSMNAWINQEDFYYVLEGQDLINYYKAVKAANFGLPASQVLLSGDQKQSCYVAVYNAGGLFAFREGEFPAEAKAVMRRFAAVFDLTYKRFLDLQKAEAQSREAFIQLALERVRSKAMAMHNSQDLADTIGVFYKELQSFSITPRRCGVGLLNKESKMGELFTWNTTEGGESLELVGKLKMEGHPILENIYKNWLTQTEYHPVLRGAEISAYYKIVRPQMRFPDYDQDQIQFGYFFFFKEGGVYAWTEKEMKEDELQIYRRFTSVLSLTYKRYRDLQRAEINAREAQIEAALERTRSQSILMQHSHELEHASQVFHEQLQLLGINSAFSYLWLLKEEEAEQTFWASWSEEKNGVVQYKSREITYPLDRTNPYIAECLIKWKSDETHPHLSVVPPEGVKNYFETWEELFRDVESLRPEAFPGGLCYADAYMKYGSFGVVMNRDLTEEEYNILRRFSIEFERTYTRFLDLKQTERLARQSEQDLIQLKIEKQKTEEALAELQSTQKQLIQAEKMASLGELTAGIAHEIQNPLNFVNNFSEVSNELIDEMMEEVNRGNIDEAKTLAEDIRQNLQKITHHGKRADGIVKGMLQHSRSSSGQKELTDINALADEYLRLSYHGLRAKDKSFNAKFEAKLDPSIGKISIVPQDIGRVILNLINNAFYAVSEKKKNGIPRYEPTVIVATRLLNDKVEIRVSDNGNGVPEQVRDKILQPFFTTKPTGQGTGLGLSLSYDIVKAHGGELRFETTEGAGTTFIILIPQ